MTYKKIKEVRKKYKKLKKKPDFSLLKGLVIAFVIRKILYFVDERDFTSALVEGLVFTFVVIHYLEIAFYESKMKIYVDIVDFNLECLDLLNEYSIKEDDTK